MREQHTPTLISTPSIAIVSIGTAAAAHSVSAVFGDFLDGGLNGDQPAFLTGGCGLLTVGLIRYLQSPTSWAETEEGLETTRRSFSPPHTPPVFLRHWLQPTRGRLRRFPRRLITRDGRIRA